MVGMRRRGLYSLGLFAAVMIGLVGLGNTPSWGQSFSAAISGVVRDTTGAVVPGVMIIAKHTESGQTRTVITNENEILHSGVSSQ